MTRNWYYDKLEIDLIRGEALLAREKIQGFIDDFRRDIRDLDEDDPDYLEFKQIYDDAIKDLQGSLAEVNDNLRELEAIAPMFIPFEQAISILQKVYHSDSVQAINAHGGFHYSSDSRFEWEGLQRALKSSGGGFADSYEHEGYYHADIFIHPRALEMIKQPAAPTPAVKGRKRK